MPRNTDTEFLVEIKFGDRVKKVAVRSPGIHKPEEAVAHIKALQGEGKMFKGEVMKATERNRTDKDRPEVLNELTTNGIKVDNPGATTNVV